MRFTAFLLCMGRECAIENGPSRDHLPRTLPSEQKQQTESTHAIKMYVHRHTILYLMNKLCRYLLYL